MSYATLALRLGLAGALLTSLGAVAAQQPSPDRERLAQSLQRGDALKAEGRFAEALRHYEDAVAIAEKLPDLDDLQVAKLRNTLALLYDEAGLEVGPGGKAEQHYLRCLAVAEDRLGKQHANTITCRGNLASLYCEQGAFPKAAALMEENHRQAAEHLGEDHAVTATCAHNLAELYDLLGRYREALALGERAAAARAKRLGEDHPDLAVSLLNLAAVYDRLGQPNAAAERRERALRIFQTRLGPDHPSVAHALGSKAVALMAQGDYSAVPQELLETCYRIRQSALGADHPLVAATLNNLGELHRHRGQYHKARDHYERGLAVLERRFGKDHPDAATFLNNLGELHRDAGRYRQAEDFYARGLEVLRKRLPDGNHPLVARGLNNLGVLYQAMGLHQEARDAYGQVLTIWQARGDVKHPDAAAFLCNLAAFNQSVGDFDKALACYRSCLDIWATSCGPDHPNVARALSNQALLHLDRGEAGQAEKLLVQSLAIVEKRYGPAHPLTAEARNNLAVVYRKKGQHEQAGLLWKATLETLGSIDPERAHPQTAECLASVAASAAAQGDWEKAAKEMDEASRAVRRHVATVLPGLPEPDQFQFLQNQYRRIFHGALALALVRRDDPAAAERSAGWVLNGKGVVQEVAAERAQRERDRSTPEAAQLIDLLGETRAQLASLVARGPLPGQVAAAYGNELRKQTVAERDLVKRLGQLPGNTPAGEPWVELKTVRSALADGTVLIEIARFEPYDYQTDQWGEARYIAWVIPPAEKGTVRVVDLKEAAAVDRQSRPTGGRWTRGRPAAAGWRPSWVGNSPPRYSTRSSRTCATRGWLLSPDAALWLVPWSALPLGDKSCVLERHRVRYLNTGRDLVRQGSRRAPGPSLVFAGPDFDLGQKAPPPDQVRKGDPTGFPRNWGNINTGVVEGFTKAAAALADDARVPPKVYADKHATEQAFRKAEAPRRLLVLTHGCCLDDPQREGGAGKKRGNLPAVNPLLRCGLALAGANVSPAGGVAGDDGISTGLEIVGTDLRGTDLVVLCACQSGLGEVRNGESTASLRQAFQLAGARGVVATLWNVPADVSASLIAAFGERVANGQDAADALHEVQLSYLKANRGSHEELPWFWAGLTFTGQTTAAQTAAPVSAVRAVVVSVDAGELRDGERVLARLQRGQRLTVEETRGDWLRVTAPGQGQPLVGWIHRRDVTIEGAPRP